MMHILFYVCALFATQNDFNYVEYRDVRDFSNNFHNLNVTYEICALINDNAHDIEQCAIHAHNRAISIDA